MCGDKTGEKRDVSFLWTLYHKAMAVNLLRAQVGSEIEDNCTMCDLRTPEARMHKFYECPRARLPRAWPTTTLLHAQTSLECSSGYRKVKYSAVLVLEETSALV
jgi:hypothetical protein